MKKNKFLKTLAAISLSAVAAAGCISLAACGHTHSTTHGWEKDSTHHWHVCDEDNEEFDKAEHTYTDGVCVCGKTDPNAGTGGGTGTGSEANQPVSWLAKDLTASDATIGGGETAVTDNALFTVKSELALVCSVGDTALTTSGDTVKGVPNTGKPVTATLQDGTSYTFLQGLKQNGNTEAATDENTGVDSAKITVTAKAAVTLRVYITMSNDKFNSDRLHTITYKVGNGTPVTSTKATARNTLVQIEVAVNEGDVLEIYGTNYAVTPEGKSATTAKLWLFGVEAKQAS